MAFSTAGRNQNHRLVGGKWIVRAFASSHDLSIKQLSNSSQLVCFRQSWRAEKAFMQLQGLPDGAWS